MKSVADMLHEAREYIEKHGWIQDELRDPTTRKVCAYGGLYYSQRWWRPSEKKKDHTEEIQAVSSAVLQAVGLEPGSPTGNPLNNMIAWNDEENRTKQEVLDAFAKAEKIARTGFDPDKGVEV